MLIFTKVPLAWSSITHNKRKLSVSLAGITFAILLMFMQLGFRNALLDSNVQIAKILDADLVLTNRLMQSLSSNESFAKRRMYQALAFPGVEEVSFVHFGYKNWKNLETGTEHKIRTIAFDPDMPTFLDPEINSYSETLKLPGTVIIDRKSKKHFGPLHTGVKTELGGKTVRVVGTFELGTGFAASGNAIMSYKNFLNSFKEDSAILTESRKVELGLLRISKNINIPDLLDSLNQFYAKDIVVLTKEEFVERERDYWLKSTPVGFVFGLGTIMGFIVGVIICYQILYTDVMDHLSQFATLKAIGYSSLYLISVVLKQAVLLALLGFVPGYFVSAFFYKIISWLLGLPMILGIDQVILVLILTVGMCIISGFIAVRKVISTDPAELF